MKQATDAETQLIGDKAVALLKSLRQQGLTAVQAVETMGFALQLLHDLGGPEFRGELRQYVTAILAEICGPDA
jgi:hypothetical protein